MTHMKFAAIALSVILVILPAGAQTIKRVLWFGNSFSVGMAPGFSDLINCDTCSNQPTGFDSLRFDWRIWPSCWIDCHEERWPAFANIDTGHYDFVLFQDNVADWTCQQSNYEWTKNSYADRITGWATHVKNAGGKLIILQGWISIAPGFCSQAGQDRSDFWYDSLAKATGSILAPAGHAWWQGSHERPELEYVDAGWNDGHHPGRVGAFINACVIFAAITGKSPVGNKKHELMADHTLWSLTNDEALFAQQKAWEAYQYFNGTTDARDESSRNRIPRNSFQASYQLSSNRITIAGNSLQNLRMTKIDGTMISLQRVDENTVMPEGKLCPGLYFIQVIVGGKRQISSLRILPTGIN